jgi:hypothetical protein
VYYDATSTTNGKINVQKVKSADLQKVMDQIKKGNVHKIAQVAPPGMAREGKGERRGNRREGDRRGEEGRGEMVKNYY